MNGKKLFITVIIFYTLAFAINLHAGGTPENSTTINIAAAGNLTEVLPELNNLFREAHPEIELNISFASTGKLSAQIINGAPFDILIAANTACPEKLKDDGYTAGYPVVYARGEIILFTRYGTGFNEGLTDLIDAETYRHIVIANPELAPYGKAAREALGWAGVGVSPERLIIAESIKQAATLAVTAADAGILAKSTIILNPELNTEGLFWTGIPAESYEPINQAMVMLDNAAWKQNPEVLESYFNFILSDEAAGIFRAYGYSIPGDEDA